MPASVTLNITVNAAKADADVNKLKTEVDALTKTPHVVQFTTAGGDVVVKEAKSATTALLEAAAAEQRRMTAAENRAAAEVRNATASINAASKEEQAQARAALSAQKHSEKMEELAARTNSATTSTNAFAVALGNIAARAFHLVISKITKSVREAVTEMKNVDTELTNISKVSGITGAALSAIGDRAYETASKYGIAASEYLSAVYDMQKAGMGGQAETMGELAIKTMLVGDTTQEVASKFLIAANAAWKLDGNMERLSQIVDEADYINNNYATTLDKLAAGMPIVASVAAQAGMSTEETLAALGTITAVTQESGTKAATALRALILNIEGAVGEYVTEEGEAFEVTEESVKSLEGMLWKYAGAEMQAAKDAGELINPLTAIRALSEAIANSDVNQAEIFTILSSMGGKLRTNQLTALVENFDLLGELLDGMGGAAGTADKEIDLMMSSWERKTQQLKNTWTEFIADILDTEAVKSAIDGLTGTIESLDKLLFPDQTPKKSVYEAAFEEYSNLSSRAGELTQIEAERLAYLEAQLPLLKAQAEEEAKIAAERLNKKLTQDGYWSAYDENGEAVGFTGYTSRDQAVLNDLRGQYRELSKAVGEFDEDTQTYKVDIDAYKESLRGLLDTNKDYYQSVLEAETGGARLTEQQKDFKALYESIGDVVQANITGFEELGDGVLGLYDATGQLLAKVSTEQVEQLGIGTQTFAEAVEQARDAIEGSAFGDFAEGVKEANQNFAELVGERAREIEAFAQSVNESYGATNGLTTAEGESAQAAGEIADAAGEISFEGATASANGLLSVLTKISHITAPGTAGMGPLAFGWASASGTSDAPGGPTLVNELGPELISDRGRAYIANGGKPAVVNLHPGAIVIPADETRQALKGGIPKYARANTWDFMGGGSAGATAAAATAAATVTAATYQSSPLLELMKLLPGPDLSGNTTPSATPSAKKAASGGGKSAKETALELAAKTEDVLANLDKQAKLAANRGQYGKEAGLYEKAQKQIDKAVAAYKKAGYKETSDEILDLLNKRYDYQSKIDTANQKSIKEAAQDLSDILTNLDKQADLAEKQEDYLGQVQFYEAAQEAIAEMVDKYRAAGYADDSTEILALLQKNYDYADKQVSVYKDRWNELIDALEEDTDAQELANALAEKQQAVEDARLALENAQKNRTIRYYNAATGQWEWVHDQSKVASAQETLTKAEESYADELKSQAIKELENLRDSMADLNDVILGPALSAIVMKAESSDEFQNFARALNAVYGVGTYLNSTAANPNTISTATDSHDTIYTFGNVTLTEEQASSMSVAELAQRLQVLKMTS